MLSEQMLATELGQQYLDERFTMVALAFGPPDHNKSLAFGCCIEQVFGFKHESLSFNAIEDWFDRYHKWYREQAK